MCEYLSEEYDCKDYIIMVMYSVQCTNMWIRVLAHILEIAAKLHRKHACNRYIDFSNLAYIYSMFDIFAFRHAVIGGF